MDKDNERQVVIGMVKYLNTAPIHEKWKETVHRERWTMVEAAPATLNRMLSDGRIDLGFVSSFEYAVNPENYQIMAGLSISANGPVGSVFLFSHVPLEQLDGASVLLTSQSQTSVSLVKIILEDFHKVFPKFTEGDVLTPSDDYKAVLAIGDDALRLVDSSTYLYQFDLGDIWKRHTGLPFVFAVCAVRSDFAAAYPDQLSLIHSELLRCRDEGKADLAAVCRISALRIPMSEKKCYQYLTAIEYDLGAKKRTALERFFTALISRGEASPQALPLKILTHPRQEN